MIKTKDEQLYLLYRERKNGFELSPVNETTLKRSGLGKGKQLVIFFHGFGRKYNDPEARALMSGNTNIFGYTRFRFF